MRGLSVPSWASMVTKTIGKKKGAKGIAEGKVKRSVIWGEGPRGTVGIFL